MDYARPDDAALEPALWQLYRHFFDQAERRRRWSIERDIPWNECNRGLDLVIADVVESFCAVELYLPDYLVHAMPWSRPSRARTWFYANWGYEESKHSLALHDWLLKSGMRSEERMADLEGQIYLHPWQLPHDNVVAMLTYAMVQERATSLNYRNLRRRVRERGGDPALERLLRLLAVDEQTHYSFFLGGVRLYLGTTGLPRWSNFGASCTISSCRPSTAWQTGGNGWRVSMSWRSLMKRSMYERCTCPSCKIWV
ncbi:MAG TPA: acyl-ACP desaturase [Gemmataceae bacterium]|nr:acyl-ACP desaturase [Gemmataceae bacterium]